MKTKTTLFTLSAVAILALIGCGSTGNQTTSSSSQATSSSSTTSSTTTSDATNQVIEHSATSYEAYTEIIINATPEEVWNTLTNFDKMSSWSSSFQGITGEFKDGSQVTAVFKGPDGSDMKYYHTIAVQDGQSFSWSDPINQMEWLTDNHHYIVEAYGNGQTKFIQKDTYTENTTLEDGQFSAKDLATAQVAAYTTFNEELKAEVEKNK